MTKLSHKQAYSAVQLGGAVYGMKEGHKDSVFLCHDTDEVDLDAWMECDYFLLDDQIPQAGNMVDIINIRGSEMTKLSHKQAWDAAAAGKAVYGMIEGRADSVFRTRYAEPSDFETWMECDYFLLDDQVPDAGNMVDMVDIAVHARNYAKTYGPTDVADWAEELARLILVEVDRRIKR